MCCKVKDIFKKIGNKYFLTSIMLINLIFLAFFIGLISKPIANNCSYTGEFNLSDDIIKIKYNLFTDHTVNIYYNNIKFDTNNYYYYYKDGMVLISETETDSYADFCELINLNITTNSEYWTYNEQISKINFFKMQIIVNNEEILLSCDGSLIITIIMAFIIFLLIILSLLSSISNLKYNKVIFHKKYKL